MAYYMMCEEKRGKFALVDITKSDCFTRLSKFKNGGCDLREIDMFTTQFYDEDDLRTHLISEAILSFSNRDRELSIRRKDAGKYKKVIYDFLYQKDIDYIADPNKLIDFILSKLYEGDFRFVQKFANHYIRHHECSSTMPEVRAYTLESIRLGYMSRGFYETDENGDNLLKRAIKLLIYKYEQEQSGRIEYKKEIVYRNLHSMICFVNNYDKKHANEMEKQEGKIRTREPLVGEQISFI